MGQSHAQSGSPYNVVAAFSSEPVATSAVERLTAAGIPAAAITRQAPDERAGPDRTAEMRAEMQDEMAESWAGPGGFLMTPSQARGAFFGTVIAAGTGGLAGLAAGLLWAYAIDSTFSRSARVVLAVLLGIAGGVTVGFLAGGIHKPLREAAQHPGPPADGRPMTAQRDHLLAVHSNERALVERAAAILRDVGAERVHLVDGSQTPLPPQAEHPRPADPSAWWWRRAGHG